MFTVPLAAIVSYQGGLHIGACLYLLFFLGRLAHSKGRSYAWGGLGPFFWAFTSLLFWSLAGADSYIISVIGGVFGALPAYVVVYALDSMDMLRRIEEAEEAKKKMIATASSNDTAAARAEGKTAPVKPEQKKADANSSKAEPTKGAGKKKKKKRKKDKGHKASNNGEDDSNADSDGEREQAPAEANKTEGSSDSQSKESAGETAEDSDRPGDDTLTTGDAVGLALEAAEMKTVFLCPSCQSPGRERDELFLCSNPSCNNEFFEFEAHHSL